MKGFVYIFTNPCLDGWVKIGMTERDDIEARLRELNSPPNIPLTFRCYATYSVENPVEVEKCIHNIIDNIDYNLHAREQLGSGRIREREFFKISPERAFGILSNIAKLRNDVKELKVYEPTKEETAEQQVAESTSRHINNSFKSLNIPIGSILNFLYDDTIKAKVVDNKNQVEFGSENYSISALASKLLIEKMDWSHKTKVNGWMYFTKDGVVLSELRDIDTNDNES